RRFGEPRRLSRAAAARALGRGCLTRFREFVHLRCRPLIVAIGTAGETACPTLLDQSFGELGGAGGFACRRKLISIAHPNPENGAVKHYASYCRILITGVSKLSPRGFLRMAAHIQLMPV